jgi:hypothetical protein
MREILEQLWNDSREGMCTEKGTTYSDLDEWLLDNPNVLPNIYNSVRQGEELHLSDTLFSIFTLDEIKTIIEHRQFRCMKILKMSKDKQNEFREIIKKIEDMFDVNITLHQ